MGHLNVEIKARCTDQDRIRTLLRERKADFKGTDHQIDTYFKPTGEVGRLKLREGSIENDLIYYERENQAGPKQSKVTLFKTEPGSTLKEILVKTLGVLVVVDKKREIYYIENIKFHIDTVEGLGAFVEIEARDVEGTLGLAKLQEQCNEYLKLFGITDSDLQTESYSDLLLAAK